MLWQKDCANVVHHAHRKNVAFDLHMIISRSLDNDLVTWAVKSFVLDNENEWDETNFFAENYNIHKARSSIFVMDFHKIGHL